ncbi:MAG: efflux RND transporter periplasmic adaptor subunit [Elusimicrobiaceae bacterium]|nr:efflux RND transporter periplasmic adaptor subunit [Elusimicrobiaceae bacterium]
MNKQQIKLYVKQYWKYALVFVVGAAIGFFIKGKLGDGAGGMDGAGGPASVLAQTVSKRPVALGKTFIAKVEAINASDVTPQVSGYIDKVLFKDGSFVKEGEVLFIIDQARYQAAASAAEAALEKAKASLIQIQSNYNRELSLYEEAMLSKADLEVAESSLATAQANVKSAQANFDLAKLDLQHTQVRSPISGYIGKAFLTKGNYANASASKLARVIQMDPIRVVFSITDKERLSGMDQLTALSPDLQIALPNGQTIEIPHASVFADNEINAQTATMAVYAQSENKDNKLIPGNYVNVTVSMDKFRPVILIPQTAVSQDASGPYVMTVNNDDVVVQKYITLGDMVNGQYVVAAGLEDGDRLVPIGQQKLQNGQKVNVSLQGEQSSVQATEGK